MRPDSVTMIKVVSLHFDPSVTFRFVRLQPLPCGSRILSDRILSNISRNLDR